MDYKNIFLLIAFEEVLKKKEEIERLKLAVDNGRRKKTDYKNIFLLIFSKK